MYSLFDILFLFCICLWYIIFFFREKALKTLIALATGVMPDQASLNSIEEAMLAFDNTTINILTDEEQFDHCDLQYNYLPQFLIEWVICRAWFLYLVKNIQTSTSMLKDVIKKIQNIIEINCYKENQ